MDQKAVCCLQAAFFCGMLCISVQESVCHYKDIKPKESILFFKRKECFKIMKKKDSQNYLDFIPVKNPEIEYETAENGRVTVFIEWKGFYHRIAQKFFRRPRVSDIKMDEIGSFVWLAIDDSKDVHTLSLELEKQFPKEEKPLSRLIKFLEIMHDNHLIYWKGEARK